MSRRDFHGGRAYAASATEPAGPGVLFGIGLTIAWLKQQFASLWRPSAS